MRLKCWKGMEEISVIPKRIQDRWRIVNPLFSIRNESESDSVIKRLNALIDEIGVNEQHPLYELLERTNSYASL